MPHLPTGLLLIPSKTNNKDILRAEFHTSNDAAIEVNGFAIQVIEVTLHHTQDLNFAEQDRIFLVWHYGRLLYVVCIVNIKLLEGQCIDIFSDRTCKIQHYLRSVKDTVVQLCLCGMFRVPSWYRLVLHQHHKAQHPHSSWITRSLLSSSTRIIPSCSERLKF